MEDAAHRAVRYLNSLAHRSVIPEPIDIAGLSRLDEPLPLPIVLECFERYIPHYAINAFDRLYDIR